MATLVRCITCNSSVPVKRNGTFIDHDRKFTGVSSVDRCPASGKDASKYGAPRK